MRPAARSRDLAARTRRTAALCAGLAAGMVGLAYASVPLYGLFCRITGYDGTPLFGGAPAAEILERTITVRFDANVAAGLDWRFTPEAPQVEVKLGETRTVFYKVRNAGRTATAGIATFNVQPGQAGAFFVKLQCFCLPSRRSSPARRSRPPSPSTSIRRLPATRTSAPAGHHAVLHLLPIPERRAGCDIECRRGRAETVTGGVTTAALALKATHDRGDGEP